MTSVDINVSLEEKKEFQELLVSMPQMSVQRLIIRQQLAKKVADIFHNMTCSFGILKLMRRFPLWKTYRHKKYNVFFRACCNIRNINNPEITDYLFCTYLINDNSFKYVDCAELSEEIVEVQNDDWLAIQVSMEMPYLNVFVDPMGFLEVMKKLKEYTEHVQSIRN